MRTKANRMVFMDGRSVAIPGCSMLVHSFHAAGHEVHEEIVAEVLRSSEVGFASTHGGDFLYELHEGEVAGEHEGVDHDVGALAAADLFEGLGDDQGIEAEGVAV